AVADEGVQEAWLGVLRGIDRFEGRSSLKTWIFRILTNTAKTRAERERRSVPFSSLEAEAGEDDAAVDPGRFLADGAWSTPPVAWDGGPEARLLASETRGGTGRAGAARPPRPPRPTPPPHSPRSPP